MCRTEPPGNPIGRAGVSLEGVAHYYTRQAAGKRPAMLRQGSSGGGREAGDRQVRASRVPALVQPGGSCWLLAACRSSGRFRPSSRATAEPDSLRSQSTRPCSLNSLRMCAPWSNFCGGRDGALARRWRWSGG